MAGKPKYLKSQLLLDAGGLTGSCFARTVVLVCKHNDEGAFGLVLNQPSPKKFGEVITADLSETLKEQRLFIGGPVQPTALSYLHSDDFLPDADVMPGLSLGHSLEELTELGTGYSITRKLKTFAGYAGWSPGQLESEMKREAWITHLATLDLIFDPEPERLWQKVLRRIGGWQNLLLSQMPDDLSRN